MEDCVYTQSSVAKPIFDGLPGKKWEFDSTTLLTSRYSHHEIGIRKVLYQRKAESANPAMYSRQIDQRMAKSDCAAEGITFATPEPNMNFDLDTASIVQQQASNIVFRASY